MPKVCVFTRQLTKFIKNVDSTNYFCSPLYAPDEVLKKLPPEIHVLSAAYDPLLDEYVDVSSRLLF